MDISIFTEELPKEYHWTPTNYLGGTPEYYIETATELAKRHSVQVFYDGVATEHKGVYYLPRELYEPSEVNIHCNDRAELGKKNIYWTNKVGQKSKDYMDYDERITLSKYHQSIFGDSTIIGHGIHPEQFDGSKKENLCIYTSSPDGIWKLKEFPFEKYGYKFIATYDKNISEEEMIDLYNRAKFWLHPGQRWELFCLSAVKAQQAKCMPVVVPNQALKETVKYGTRTTLDNYFEDLAKDLQDEHLFDYSIYYDAPTWENVTKKIESLFI